MKDKIASSLERINAEGYFLNHDGLFKTPMEPNQISVSDCFQDNVMTLLLSIIPLIFKPSERKSCNSYASKHIVEQWLSSRYISNGQLILAMMALGYKYKTIKGSPNVLFYGSWTEPAVYGVVKYPFEVKALV